MQQIIDSITEAISRAGLVQVEVSARHVHLCQRDLETLFGKGAALTPKRDLSQPDQFLCEERVNVVGEKESKSNVAVLGPVRPQTQVELSLSDCITLGVKAPVRESGHLDGAGSIIISGPQGTIQVPHAAIVALCHIHMTPEAARLAGVTDKQHVAVELLTSRPVTLRNVVIRISPHFRCRMHIDFDEANAAAVSGFTLGKIVREAAGTAP